MNASWMDTFVRLTCNSDSLCACNRIGSGGESDGYDTVDEQDILYDSLIVAYE